MTTPHLVTCCLWDYVQVLKQINEGSAGGRGIVVQEVHAPVAVVMGRILDYGNYPKMVSKLMTQRAPHPCLRQRPLGIHYYAR